MAEILMFPSKQSEIVQRRLEKLADKLEATRFNKNTDKEQLGRNWHTLAERLIRTKDLSKGELYVCLRGAGVGEAQKYSTRYEVPPHLIGDNLTRRAQSIVASGKIWRRLIENAGHKWGGGQHAYLVELLKGTSLRPETAPIDSATPDPINKTLKLAKEACSKLAVETGIRGYFEDWLRGWLAYVPRSNTFIRNPLFPTGRPNVGEGPPFSYYSHFYEVGEERRTSPDELDPFPTAPFAELDRLGPVECFLTGRDAGGREMERRATISLVREFRIGVGFDGLEGGAVPALELRHRFRVTTGDSGDEIAYEPDEFSALESPLEHLQRSADCFEAEDELVFLSLGGGTLSLLDGMVEVRAWANLDRREFDRLREAAEGIAGSDLPAGGQFYVPLSPEIVREFLLCGARSRPEQEAQDTPTLSPPWTALAALEAALWEGSSEGSLCSRLKSEIDRTVCRFRDAYDAILKQVLEAHEAALREFKRPAE